MFQWRSGYLCSRNVPFREGIVQNEERHHWACWIDEFSLNILQSVYHSALNRCGGFMFSGLTSTVTPSEYTSISECCFVSGRLSISLFLSKLELHVVSI